MMLYVHSLLNLKVHESRITLSFEPYAISVTIVSASPRIADELVMKQRKHSTVLVAYQSKIGQRILTSSLRVLLNPILREPGLHENNKKHFKHTYRQ